MVSRYFIEVAYMGTAYGGFQVQQNTNTVQAEVEKALQIYFRETFSLTGSSRTDAGVHARQNYFHFDSDLAADDLVAGIYNVNAILPDDIVVKNIRKVDDSAHCRFDALSRTYLYSVYSGKDPFISDRAFYYPFPLDIALLNQAAAIVKAQKDFESFAKKNSQVLTYQCTIYESEWLIKDNVMVYKVEANRFLRGMVRGLAGTMLKVGRGRMLLTDFQQIFAKRDPSFVDFSVPPHGLTLHHVKYEP